MPMVAPYSGAMFPIVARSASGSVDTPGPKNSTNFPTTPLARSICVTVSTRSVAVALTVELELEVRIDLEGAGRAELVHDHRVVDHELGGEQRIHALRVAAHLHHRVTHGGEIHDRGDAREVLQQDARRHECNFFVRHLPGVPARQVLEIFGPDDAPIFAAQQVFEQDLQRVGEFGDGQSTALERVEAVDLVRPPARLQRGAAPETVSTHCGSTFTATTKYSVSPKQVVGTPLCC